MIWHCAKCRETFDEPIEREGPAGTSEYFGMVRLERESWLECPHCQSEEIDEVEEPEEDPDTFWFDTAKALMGPR